jgi:hypothetical protein
MVILHIVGINTFIKDDIINKFRDLGYEIFDLDLISKNIMFDENKTKMGQMWKNKLSTQLNLYLSSNINKNIIILGLSTFVLDHRFKININTTHKYFLNIPPDLCASQLITYNLDNYRTDIIEGKFPIKYLEHDFLMYQRRDLQDEYINNGYKLKTFDNLFELLSELSNKKLNKVYLALLKRFEDNIPNSYIGSKPIIVGYKDKWMAIASILPKTSINRGILQNQSKTEPYLRELHLNAFGDLRKPCYLYEFDGDKELDQYRCEIKETTFNNREYISNMYDELTRDGVIMEKFKF